MKRLILLIVGLAIALVIARLASAQEVMYESEGSVLLGSATALFSSQELRVVPLSSGIPQTVTCEGTDQPHKAFYFCPTQFSIDVPAEATGLKIEVQGRGDLVLVI